MAPTVSSVAVAHSRRSAKVRSSAATVVAWPPTSANRPRVGRQRGADRLGAHRLGERPAAGGGEMAGAPSSSATRAIEMNCTLTSPPRLRAQPAADREAGIIRRHRHRHRGRAGRPPWHPRSPAPVARSPPRLRRYAPGVTAQTIGSQCQAAQGLARDAAIRRAGRARASHRLRAATVEHVRVGLDVCRAACRRNPISSTSDSPAGPVRRSKTKLPSE